MRIGLPFMVAVALVALVPAAHAGMRRATIGHVVDGDTVVLRGGEKVRLVQIDTPETYGGKECWGSMASAATKAILPPGTQVRVATDPKLDRRDRYGRTLAYVWKGSSLVNFRLVRLGMAAPYFYDGAKGRYARIIFKAAVAARNNGRGLWGHCRRGSVPLRPSRAVATGTPRRVNLPLAASPGKPGCNPHYALACVPNSRADLDCPDIRRRVRIVGSDPYNLDSNSDGFGCENYG